MTYYYFVKITDYLFSLLNGNDETEFRKISGAKPLLEENKKKT